MIVTNCVTIQDDPIWIGRACPVNAQCMKWISVDERLPKNGQRILGYFVPANEVHVVIRDGATWLSLVNEAPEFTELQEVIYWMPLPEPPK